MSLEVGNVLLWSFIFRYIFSVPQCVSVYITTIVVPLKIVKLTKFVIIATKTQPDVISILTPIKKIKLATSPQPLHHFRTTVCPSVTNRDRQIWLKIFEKKVT